jgi:IrrE N-terminal-like domain
MPIHQIAEALDIVEIQQARLKGLEGALVSAPERDIGLIVVNSASSVQRQRFTVAHELGHFLNPWHRPIEPSKAAAKPAPLPRLAIGREKPRLSAAGRAARATTSAQRDGLVLSGSPR